MRRSNPFAEGNGGMEAGALLGVLAASLSGSTRMVDGEGIEFHDGKKIMVPNGMSYQGARNVIDRAEKESETKTRWVREFLYRFNDGAYALFNVMKKRYGGAFGEVTPGSFFSPDEPPQLRTIAVSATEKAQVPEGKLSVPAMAGTTIDVIETGHREYGRIFAMVVEGPRKHAKEVEALFNDVETHLKHHSIYRGKAIVGANSPEFIDLTRFKPGEIVFSEDATALLKNTVWAPLQHADDLRAEGVPLKRAVLLHGPYGTGKTSAGLVTAVLAEAQGWTPVFGKAGKDSIEDTLRTARLYQPAVVFIEDIDNEADTGDQDKVTRLLELLDGATSKGSEVMLVVTTNHLERIHKGMLRPGRFDAVVEIAALDAPGITRLVKAVVDPQKLGTDVDFEKVSASMAGFYPAFVREAIDRARTLAITRHGRNYVLDTESLTGAADTLSEQLRWMDGATEGTPVPDLDTAFRNLVRASASGLGLVNDKNDPIPDLHVMDPDKAEVNAEFRR